MKEPEKPEAPNYVLNPIERQDPSLLEKVGNYCLALAEYRKHQDLEEIQEKDFSDKQQQKLKSGEPIRQKEKVQCGKKCAGCPHGPYIYEYRWENGKVVSEYIGKEK